MAALATFLLTACGGGSSATTTPPPAPTAAATAASTAASTQAAAAASGSSAAGATNAACPTGVANAAPFSGGARATGTIGAINGTSFTVTERNNTSATVMTDANTRYESLVPTNVGTIAVGDFITAQGTTAGTTTAATTITDAGAQAQQGAAGGNGQRPAVTAGCPPQGAGQQAASGGNANGAGNGRGFIGGTVQQVNGSTITVNTMLGTTTLTTDANTKVMRRQPGQFTDLKVGDQVTATAGRAAGGAGGSNGTASAGSATAPTSFTAALVTDQTAH
jgi:hypothetical protein